MTRFLNFISIISLELVKLIYICRSTSACVIYSPQKGCVGSHVTSLNLGKCDIISEMMQDMDMVAMENV